MIHFIYAVSHDFAGPLNNLVRYSHLKNATTQLSAKHWIGWLSWSDSYSSTQNLQEVINELQIFAKNLKVKIDEQRLYQYWQLLEEIQGAWKDGIAIIKSKDFHLDLKERNLIFEKEFKKYFYFNLFE